MKEREWGLANGNGLGDSPIDIASMSHLPSIQAPLVSCCAHATHIMPTCGHFHRQLGLNTLFGPSYALLCSRARTAKAVGEEETWRSLPVAPRSHRALMDQRCPEVSHLLHCSRLLHGCSGCLMRSVELLCRARAGVQEALVGGLWGWSNVLVPSNPPQP